MVSLDKGKQIEAELTLFRRRKQEEKTKGPSLTTQVTTKLQRCITVLVQYILPENLSTESECSGTNENRFEKNIHSDKTLSSSEIRRRKPNEIDTLAESPPEDISTEDITLWQLFASYSKIDWMILLLKILLWLIVWKLTIMIEFGAIFFICSCFLFIWLNLHSGPRRRKGLSAYSVFNPNCEELLGSYTAEKFEKEFLHR